MTYQLNRDDLMKLKEIGLSKIVQDFGEVLGYNCGGSEETVERSKDWIEDILNDLFRSVCPEDYIYVSREEEKEKDEYQ